MYFQYNREKINKQEKKKFQPRKGPSVLPGKGSVNVRVRSFHVTSKGSTNVEMDTIYLLLAAGSEGLLRGSETERFV